MKSQQRRAHSTMKEQPDRDQLQQMDDEQPFPTGLTGDLDVDDPLNVPERGKSVKEVQSEQTEDELARTGASKLGVNQSRGQGERGEDPAKR